LIGGTIRDPAHNNATLTHSAVSDNSSVKVDTTLPTVSVAITGEQDGIQNSFLNAGDNVSVTATFSETVNVSGSPTLTLVVGDDNRTAEYKSGSGSTRLVFEYMILATGTSGENDPDGISILGDTLALNNGTIRDPAHNNATLTHSAVSDNSSVKVDTTAPSVDNFTMSDTELKIGDNATVTLVFSEAVCADSSVCGSNVFSSADITSDNGSLNNTMSSSQANDNKTIWTGTFTPNDNTEDNSSRLSLATTYTDLAGNNGPDNQTENYEIDTLAPTVNSVAITGAQGDQNSFLNATDNVSVTATFSEAVIVASGNPTLILAVGSDNRTATYTSGDNSTRLVYRYMVQSGYNDSNGISIGANALDNSSSTISDPAGNIPDNLTHDAVPDNSSVKVDTVLPTLNSVAITGAQGDQNSFLNATDNVSVTATFSEAVIVASGTPRLTLAVGSDNRTAIYASGDNSTALVFRYTIKATGTAGENDDDGISIPENALALDNGTIKDLAGNNATLTHSLVSDNTSVKVDTTAPSVDNFTMSDTELKIGDNATVTLRFSEAVVSFSSAADITADNGTLAAMSSADNITWTGTFTPAANTEDDNNTLSLATSYTDTAGNAGPAATTANYAVETLAPSVNSFTLSDTALKAGDNATVTLVFSEAVASFSSADDITVPVLDFGS